MNYKLTIAFDGRDFSGWQFQKNAPTVQGVFTECATRFFSSPVSVTGCSRTDSKVHAENYVLNVKSERAIDPHGIVRGLNTFLPDSIAVKACEEVSEDFHARYDCKRKEYRYIILNSPIRDPFLVGRALQYPAPLDEKKMKSEAEPLIGTHDFASFMAAGSRITDTVRTVYSADVKREGDRIIFSISADGFLYNMVRIIVGTLIDESLGRLPLTVAEIIEAKDRKKAGFTAPPEGLYLYRAEY